MSQETSTDMNDELRPEYDFAGFLKGGERGKYADRYRAGTNLALLEPDVAEAFKDDKSVNDVLRLVLEIRRTMLHAADPE